MQKKIYYIYSHFDFLAGSAGTTRMLYYAKALADENNKVYLISCCTTDLNEGFFTEVAPNIFLHKEKVLTKRLFKTLLFVKKLKQFSQNHKGEKIFMYYPFPLVTLEVFALFYLKFVKGYAVFYELNEIPKHSSSFHAPITLKRPKYSLKKMVFKTVFTLMEPLLYFYDGIICISTAMEGYAKKFNPNTLRIPVLTDPNNTPKGSTNSYIKKGVVNIGFSGSIHPTKENLDSFLNVISKLKKEEHSIRFNLCGGIFDDYEARFQNICEQREEIVYHGNLNPVEFSTFLSQQDILVIPRGFSLQNKYGFSTKLSDYLNHKKIIVLTDISDNGLYIKDGINGFVVPPDDEDEMFKKMVYVVQNNDELAEYIVPQAIETSKKYFFYENYRMDLRDFLQDKRK